MKFMKVKKGKQHKQTHNHIQMCTRDESELQISNGTDRHID